MSTCFKHARSAPTRWLILAIGALLLSACGNNDPDPAAPEAAAAVTGQRAETRAAEDASGTDAPAPYITFSLRGMVEKRIEVGEPLFISVRIEAPDDDSPAMQLAPASGSWADHLTVAITHADGAEPILQAKPTAPVETTPISLQGEHAATGMWVFSSAQTQQLTAGAYQVQVRLAIADGSGWTGAAESRAQPLQVVTASAGGAVQRALALANEAILKNTPQDAARLLDDQLDKTPDNIRLLTLRAKVSSRAGNYVAAMQCVQRGMQLAEIQGWQQPPLDLYMLETELMLAMSGTSDSVDQTNLPDWSDAPASVLGRLHQDRPKDSGTTDDTPVLEPLEPIVPPASTADTAPVVQATQTAPADTTIVTKTAAAAPGNSIGSVVPPAELDEAKILADPNGQWASGARAGTEYGSSSYGAAQLIGAPDVPGAGGDSPNAWTHSSASIALEWIELDFAKPVHASELRVRQNNLPGAIVKVEGIEPDGSAHTWWEGVDPYMPPDDIDLAWFAVRVPATTYLVTKVKVTLNLATRPGWKEIDAVQLVGTTP